MTEEPRLRRILVKLSGEALMGDQGYGISQEATHWVADEIAGVADLGVQICLVIGGGNIFRGVEVSDRMDRATADYMGMLATIMNALALQDALQRKGLEVRVQSALKVEQVVEPYVRAKAMRYLEKGFIVVFAAGTGNPFFTTDTAASLRGMEMNVELVFKATKDGVYTADPMKDPTAKRYERLTFDEAIYKDLKVMDATAFTLCREQNLPICVLNIFKRGALRRAVLGENEGTWVGI